MAPSASTRAPRSLADDLRERTPGQIRRLLALRPDLLHPWPADLSELARRAADDASVLEALQSLSVPQLRVLEVFACLHEAQVSQVAAGLGEAEEEIAGIIGGLWDRGLLWGRSPLFRIVRAAQQTFGPHPCGLGPGGHTEPDPQAIREAALDLDPDRLRHLVWESPVSTTDTPLVVTRGEQFVVLRETALVLREGRYLPAIARPEPVEPTDPAPVDGMWAPLAGVRHLLTDLRRTGLAWHGTRGVSRRVLTDRARSMNLPFDELLAWLELALTASLVGPVEDELRPTPLAATWLREDPSRMWSALVGAWLDSDRLLLRCRPDELGAGTAAGTPRTALHRRNVVQCWPDGRADHRAVRDLLAWERPRMVEAQDQSADVAAELTLLGLLVADVPTAALGALPDDLQAAAAHVPAAAQAGLIVQPDLTVIVPLNVDTPTWLLLDEVSRLESWGPVTIHRLDAALIRTAVGHKPPEDLLAELAAASRTPLPQSLEYLVRDAARTQPVRVWQATVVRAAGEDVQALREMGFEEVAPMTFTSAEPLAVVRQRLENAGVAIETEEQPPVGLSMEYPRASAHDPHAIDRLVQRLVGADEGVGDPPVLEAVDPATVAARCRQAIAAGECLWLECSEAGATLTHLVEPFELRSGLLSGWSLSAGRTVSIALARISAIGDTQ